jgi:hypothetical protein
MDDATLLDAMRRYEARQARLPETPAPTPAVITERLRSRLAEARAREPDETFKVTLPDPWQRTLFVALCTRYRLHVHREARQRRSTLLVCAPPAFYGEVLWPEFSGLATALLDRFDALTRDVVRDVLAVHGLAVVERDA